MQYILSLLGCPAGWWESSLYSFFPFLNPLPHPPLLSCFLPFSFILPVPSYLKLKHFSWQVDGLRPGARNSIPHSHVTGALRGAALAGSWGWTKSGHSIERLNPGPSLLCRCFFLLCSWALGHIQLGEQCTCSHDFDVMLSESATLSVGTKLVLHVPGHSLGHCLKPPDTGR